jgi:hypothetical protein
MKPFNTLFLLILLPYVAGCAGVDAAMQYRETTMVEFPVAGHDWRIFDKATENRLMITPSLGRSMTTGLPGGDIPKPEYESAVEAWLLDRHQPMKCVVKDGYPILPPQWEFKYHCL